MNGYTTSILEASKQLTKKESVLLKDLTNAIQLDPATEGDSHVTFKPQFYAIISVHNESSKEKDYNKYVLVDKDGTKYVTGSESFWDSFNNIWTEMEDSDEDWELDVYKQPSKNYAGKGFLTCSII